MGVDATTYIVYGVKRDYDSELMNKVYDQKDCDSLFQYVIADGMCGKYIVFGNIISSVEPYQDEEFIVLDDINREEKKEEYLSNVREQFPELEDVWSSLEKEEFKLLFFIHYS